MNRGKLRLALAVFLFVAWIGYLAYLVAVTRDPVILSRPQFLVSNLYIVADLSAAQDHPDGAVKVQEVAWTADEADRKLQGAVITVLKLDKCQEANGWTGPGVYILPLTKIRDDLFLLTETPPSPGFFPGSAKDEHRIRIYPATQQARRQLEDLVDAMK